MHTVPVSAHPEHQKLQSDWEDKKYLNPSNICLYARSTISVLTKQSTNGLDNELFCL